MKPAEFVKMIADTRQTKEPIVVCSSEQRAYETFREITGLFNINPPMTVHTEALIGTVSGLDDRSRYRYFSFEPLSVSGFEIERIEQIEYPDFYQFYQTAENGVSHIVKNAGEQALCGKPMPEIGWYGGEEIDLSCPPLNGICKRCLKYYTDLQDKNTLFS